MYLRACHSLYMSEGGGGGGGEGGKKEEEEEEKNKHKRRRKWGGGRETRFLFVLFIHSKLRLFIDSPYLLPCLSECCLFPYYI